MIIHETDSLGNPLKQGSRDWWALRLGIPTCSSLGRIIQPAKMGYSSGARPYIAELLAEQILGVPTDPMMEQESDGGTQWTERGLELEPRAKAWYELERGATIRQVAFITTDDGSEGGSPDGLVGDDGIIEVKCYGAKHHMSCLLGLEEIAPKVQVQGYLRLTGRQWCDSLAWHPTLPIRLDRVYRDDIFIAKLDECMAQFKREMAEAKKRLDLIGSAMIDDGGLKAQLLASIALFQKDATSNDAMLSMDEIDAYTKDVRWATQNGVLDKADEEKLIEDVVKGRWDDTRTMWAFILRNKEVVP